MKKFATLAAALGFVLVAVTVAAHAAADTPSGALPEHARSVERELIVVDVIEGRMSLLEGAAAFHELTAKFPKLSARIDELFPADSEGEQACLHVISSVRQELQTPTTSEGANEKADAVLGRLEAELKAARDKDGKVSLPGSDD